MWTATYEEEAYYDEGEGKMKIKTFFVALMSLLLAVPTVLAYNSCLPAALVSDTNVSADLKSALSAVCDRQDAVSSNVTALSLNVITMINQLQNVSKYVNSDAMNQTIRNTTLDYLGNVPSLANLTQAVIDLSNAYSNVSALKSATDSRFLAIADIYVTKDDLAAVTNNITTLGNQIANRPEGVDWTTFLVLVVVSDVGIFGICYLFLRRPATARPTVSGTGPGESTVGSLLHRGQVETDLDANIEQYIRRKGLSAAQEKKVREALDKIKATSGKI